MFAYIGANRVGKTSVAREAIIKWKLANLGRLVVGFDPQNKLKDLIDIEIFLSDTNEELENKILNSRNALIVLDDYKVLHPKNIAEKWLLNLLQFRCEYNLDIIYIIHSPGLVLTTLTYYTTHYFIFYTQTTKEGWQKKIPNYEYCKNASDMVNEHVSTYGKGKYPNFPYIVLETENQKYYFNNINYKISQRKGILTLGEKNKE